MKPIKEIIHTISKNLQYIKDIEKHFGLDEIRLLNLDSLKFQILIVQKQSNLSLSDINDFKLLLEDLLGCVVEIVIYDSLHESLKNTYYSNTIPIEQSLKKIENFFDSSASYLDFREQLSEEDDVFGSDRVSLLEVAKRKIANKVNSDKQSTIHSYLNIASREQWNELFIAIYANQLENFKKIVASDEKSLQHRDRLGNTACHIAAAYDRQELLSWLFSDETAIAKKYPDSISLSVKNKEGQTPFLTAVYSGKIEMIKFLLNSYPEMKRAFLTEKDRFGKDALLIARFYNKEQVYELLKNMPLEASQNNMLSKESSSKQSESDKHLVQPQKNANASPSINSANEKIYAHFDNKDIDDIVRSGNVDKFIELLDKHSSFNVASLKTGDLDVSTSWECMLSVFKIIELIKENTEYPNHNAIAVGHQEDFHDEDNCQLIFHIDNLMRIRFKLSDKEVEGSLGFLHKLMLKIDKINDQDLRQQLQFKILCSVGYINLATITSNWLNKNSFKLDKPSTDFIMNYIANFCSGLKNYLSIRNLDIGAISVLAILDKVIDKEKFLDPNDFNEFNKQLNKLSIEFVSLCSNLNREIIRKESLYSNVMSTPPASGLSSAQLKLTSELTNEIKDYKDCLSTIQDMQNKFKRLYTYSHQGKNLSSHLKHSFFNGNSGGSNIDIVKENGINSNHFEHVGKGASPSQ